MREARQHPNADRLRLCTVETRHGVFEVVCGAPNARTGMKGIFAPEGSVIPVSGEVLKKAAIRGVASVGMLCSMRELKLGDEHDGIIELPPDVEVGAPAAKALGLEGPVIEIKLTPDRSDCFGVAGIARDLAAAGLGRLPHARLHGRAGDGCARPGDPPRLPAGEEKACPLFVGRIIRGVRNGPSPAWLRNRLKAIGLRPISALVDITNYLTFDLSRPLHVFDAAKLEGDLVLRFARLGEELHALDGRTYRLDDGMTVIADATGPVSLGGIMGGEGTGVTEATTDDRARGGPVRSAAHGGHRATPRHRERRAHALRARARPGAGAARDRVRHAADPRAVRRRSRSRGRSPGPSRRRPRPCASGARACSGWPGSTWRRRRSSACSRRWASRSAAAPTSGWSSRRPGDTT